MALVPNNQIFNAYLIWADRDFNLVWGGSKLPTTWLVTLDAVVSVTFLAGVALFWRWWGRFRKEPDELSKLIIGSCFSMAGMLCLVMAASSASGGAKIGLFWPVMFHVLNSIGFAHIVPIGLALFARLAPKQINSTIIGIYFLAFFTANTLVGWVGGWFETMPTPQFWLMHFGFAATGFAVFIVYKLVLGRFLFASDGKTESG